MLFSRLKGISSGTLHIHEDVEVNHVCIDSRTATGQSAEVFIGLKGKRDGSDFAEEAYQKGTRNFILSKSLDLPDSNIFEVEDPLQLLQQIATHHRKTFSIPIIAVTGSNGKTFVKEWLSTLLSERFFVVKSPKSYNSQVGVPLSLLDIRPYHEVGVFEAGISKHGEMEVLESMIKPRIGIFTNLGFAHDDGFASQSDKLKEKLKLFDSAKQVVCRGDQPYSDAAKEILRERFLSWSLDAGADYKVKWQEHQVVVGDHAFSCTFTGTPMLENLTHAIIVALELGLSNPQIQKGINLLENVPMRLEWKRAINGSYLLDDSYNNDIGGLKVALEHLESQQENTNRTLILSDILHSAQKDEDLYREVAALLQAKGVSRLIGVGERISACADQFSLRKQFFSSTGELLSNLPEIDREMILVKGARDFQLEQVVVRLEEKTHGTVLEVSFDALTQNLNQYRNRLSKETKLMVMVKANSYGAGLPEISNFLQHQRIDLLGVAYIDEAILLRKNGIHIPIMIMNPYIESFDKFERFDLQAEIFSIRHFDRMLEDTEKPPSIHIKIDTGMHRLGFSPEQMPVLLERLKANPQVHVEGVFTHFSSADNPREDSFTRGQAAKFEKAYDQIVGVIGYRPTKHACNSPGIVRWPEYHFDMVRLGIGLHGFDITDSLNLKYPATLKTVVSQIQHLHPGDTVGYSRMGKISKESEIAVLPIGYEDGYLRVFGNGNGKVDIKGKLCPVVGNVCMDMTMVDVTGLEVSEGDHVVIFGEQPTIKDLAHWAGTIPYEILTNVSSRVKRVFIHG